MSYLFYYPNKSSISFSPASCLDMGPTSTRFGNGFVGQRQPFQTRLMVGTQPTDSCLFIGISWFPTLAVSPKKRFLAWWLTACNRFGLVPRVNKRVVAPWLQIVYGSTAVGKMINDGCWQRDWVLVTARQSQTEEIFNEDWRGQPTRLNLCLSIPFPFNTKTHPFPICVLGLTGLLRPARIKNRDGWPEKVISSFFLPQVPKWEINNGWELGSPNVSWP